MLVGEIESKAFRTEALVIDRIGTDEDGKDIEILFGAITQNIDATIAQCGSASGSSPRRGRESMLGVPKPC